MADMTPAIDAMQPSIGGMGLNLPPGLTAGLDESRARMRDLEGKIQSNTKDYETKLNEPTPEMDALRKQYIEPTPPPKQEGKIDPSDLAIWGVMAALGGLGTRSPAMNAMGALTAALTGYREGSKQKFEQSMKAYDEQAGYALKRNESLTRQITQIRQDRNKTLEMKKSLIESLYKQHGLLDKSEKSLEGLYTTAEKLKKMGADGRLSDLRIKHVTQQMLYPPGTAQGLDEHGKPLMNEDGSPVLRSTAAASKAGGAQAFVPFSENLKRALAIGYREGLGVPLAYRNKDYQNQLTEVKNLAADPKFTYSDDERNRAYDMSNPAVAAKTVVEKNFGPGGKIAQTIQASSTLARHMETMLGLVDSVENNSDIRLINKYKNRAIEEGWATSEDAQNLSNAGMLSSLLGKELLKAIIPGGGAMTERLQSAASFAIEGKSTEAIRAAIITAREAVADNLYNTYKGYDAYHKMSIESFADKFLQGQGSLVGRLAIDHAKKITDQEFDSAGNTPSGGGKAIPGQPEQSLDSSNLPKIDGDAAYNALPSGTRFVDPKGVTRVKP